MGVWCYITRQTPQVYLSLTQIERDAFEEAAQKLQEKGW